MQSLNDLLLMAKIKMDGLGYTPMIRGVDMDIPEVNAEFNEVSTIFNKIIAGIFGGIGTFVVLWVVIQMLIYGLTSDATKKAAQKKKVKSMFIAVIGIVVVSASLLSLLLIIKPYILKKFQH